MKVVKKQLVVILIVDVASSQMPKISTQSG